MQIKITRKKLGVLVTGFTMTLLGILIACSFFCGKEVFAFCVYAEALFVIIITGIISILWFIYKKGNTTKIYLFLTIERIGLAITIATGLYARYLLLYETDKWMVYVSSSNFWLYRNVFLAVGSTLYFGRVLYQLLIPFLCEKKMKSCPRMRVDDE